MSSIKTRRRYELTGGDFSSQEVKVFACFCKDPSMREVFNQGHDLYSTIASMVYNLPYDECREFRPDGSFNLEGKQRRNRCKSLVLGLLYGRGVSSIADQIKSHPGATTKEDIQEAKNLSEQFFEKYPMAKAWIDQTHEDARKYGYVEDLWGRRRRLPDINLPKYSFQLKGGNKELFNPLLGTTNKYITPSPELVEKYTLKLDKARTKEARQIICNEALKDNLEISCNSGYIAQAERQSINSRIQGSSATMTKLAMRNIYRDKIMNDIDFHLLVPVHDEVIGEAPVWNIEQARDRLSYLMMHAGEPECDIKMKVDGDIWGYWYQDVTDAHIKEEYEDHIKNGLTDEEAFNKVHEDNCEFTAEQIRAALDR